MKQVVTATAFALVVGVAVASVTAEDKTSEHARDVGRAQGHDGGLGKRGQARAAAPVVG